MTHAAVFVLILFITARMPDPTSSRQATSIVSSDIVWIPRPGPGGGGGGGGNRSSRPPARAEAPGADRATVRARPQPATEAARSLTPPPEPVVQLDALPTAAGITELPGVMIAPPNPSSSLGPGSDLGAGDGRRGGEGSGDGTGFGPGHDRGSGGGHYEPGANGVTYPRLVREIAPMYTNGALQARVQGVVELRALVRADGTVGDVWVTRSLDLTFGLDDEAVRTVKQWRFVPATQGGRPVAVLVPIELRFTIR